MGKISKKVKEWRRKQPRAAIMSPETFQQIVKEAEARGLPAERATKVAGKAYWRTVQAKYRESKRRK